MSLSELISRLEKATEGSWITLDVERLLYVDRGRETIVCDRLDGPATILIRVSDAALRAAEKEKEGS